MAPPDPSAAPTSDQPVSLPALVGMALVSGTLLFCEIAFTRYFSFRLWYHYAFMIISIALLGMGAASTLLALSRRWLERFDRQQVLATMATLFGVTLTLALRALDGLNERFVSRLERSPGDRRCWPQRWPRWWPLCCSLSAARGRQRSDSPRGGWRRWPSPSTPWSHQVASRVTGSRRAKGWLRTCGEGRV